MAAPFTSPVGYRMRMTGYESTHSPIAAGMAMNVDNSMHSLILSFASFLLFDAIAVATAGISAVDVADESAIGMLIIGLKR